MKRNKTEIDFWKDYIKADIIKRDEMLKNLVNVFESSLEIEDEEMRKQMIKSLLRSYFDDLIGTLKF